MDDARNSEIGVVIPSSGRGTVFRSLRSLSAQTLLPSEVVLAMNAEKWDRNGIQAACAELQILGIKVTVLDLGPVGVQRARNIGLGTLNTEFAVLLDDDDEMGPKRLQEFQSHWSDSVSFLFSDDIQLSEAGQVVGQTSRPTSVMLLDIVLWNCVGNQVFTRRSRIAEVAGYDELLLAAQDHDLWIRLIERFGRAQKIESAQQNVYFSTTSISRDPKKRKAGYRRSYLKHRKKVTGGYRRWRYMHYKFSIGQRLVFGELLGVLVSGIGVRYLFLACKMFVSNRRFRTIA